MTGKRQTRRRRKFGSIRQLPSKKWQATYKHGGRTHTAPTTFRTASDASAYLSKIELELRSGMWVSPEAGRISFADYSRRWLDERTALRPRTVELYEGLLRLHLLPAFASGIGHDPVAALGIGIAALLQSQTRNQRHHVRHQGRVRIRDLGQ